MDYLTWGPLHMERRLKGIRARITRREKGFLIGCQMCFTELAISIKLGTFDELGCQTFRLFNFFWESRLQLRSQERL